MIPEPPSKIVTGRKTVPEHRGVPMNWRTYEQEIYEHLATLYPGASIRRNVQLYGKQSKRDRQIDVLIEDDVAGFRTRIVVDGKYFGRRVNVTHVESFIGLLEDVSATHGLMVTTHGYSKAAMQRVRNHTKEILLDVLSLSELRDYQGHAAIPYSGKKAMWINAPFGWVVDSRWNETCLATLYQRGRTQDEARRAHEWMYVNYWHKNDDCSTLIDLLRLHTQNMKEVYSSLRTSDFSGPVRADGRITRVRIARYDNKPFKEITGYIDGDGLVAFFVLFTTPDLEATNTRKLMHVLKYSAHFEIKIRNERVIASLRKSIKSMENTEERAAAHTQIAIWYAEMDKHEMAIRHFRHSFRTSPTVYRNFKPLMASELRRSRTTAAAECAKALFRLAPENPRVMQDILDVYGIGKYDSALRGLIQDLVTEHTGDREAEVNIGFHYGLQLLNSGNLESAVQTLDGAKRVARSISSSHSALAGITNMLREVRAGENA